MAVAGAEAIDTPVTTTRVTDGFAVLFVTARSGNAAAGLPARSRSGAAAGTP